MYMCTAYTPHRILNPDTDLLLLSVSAILLRSYVSYINMLVTHLSNYSIIINSVRFDTLPGFSSSSRLIFYYWACCTILTVTLKSNNDDWTESIWLHKFLESCYFGGRALCLIYKLAQRTDITYCDRQTKILWSSQKYQVNLWPLGLLSSLIFFAIKMSLICHSINYFNITRLACLVFSPAFFMYQSIVNFIAVSDELSFCTWIQNSGCWLQIYELDYFNYFCVWLANIDWCSIDITIHCMSLLSS